MTDLFLKASSEGDAQRIADFYRRYSNEFVRARTKDDVEAAAQQGRMIHIEDARKEIVAALERSDEVDLSELGGGVVSLERFKLMRLMGKVMSVDSHIVRPGVTVCATVFEKNERMIRRLDELGFEQWRDASSSFRNERIKKAGHDGFRIYRAPDFKFRPWAVAILGVEGAGQIQNSTGHWSSIQMDHPVFSKWRTSLLAVSRGDL